MSSSWSTRPRYARSAMVLGAASILAASSADARDPNPVAAHDGLAAARAAARAWSPDAVLVYVENDEVLTTTGASNRWGFLYHSASLDRARAYSVRDDVVLHAEDLAFALEAPPLDPGWMDSDAALLVADEKGGSDYRVEHGGAAASMVLMRGAIDAEKPDVTTWLVVYEAEGQASLFVVVNAESGKAVRTWRG